MRSPIHPGVFGRWNERASVRTKPVRMMTQEDAGLLLFSPEAIPVLRHPLVQARPELHPEIIAHSLYHYLNFTSYIEYFAVIPVTARIATSESGLAVPDEMRRDAYKIATDEAWHAQFGNDFIHSAAQVSGVRPVALGRPDFMAEVSRIRESLGLEIGCLADTMFAVVTETLISRLLAEIPRDERLARPVRDLVADHAEDEGRHHAYFRALLKVVWPQLTAVEQRVVGVGIPKLVSAFLRPDRSAAARMLRACGMSRTEAAVIVGDCLPSEDSPDLGKPARSTVAAFREVGALADPAVAHEFFLHNLIAEQP